MSSEEIIRLVCSLIGGGVAVGIINWIREANKDKANRAAEFLALQLRSLYGPLYFFCSENQSIFQHIDTINLAYKAEYIDIKYAESAHESISKEANQTIDLSNRYVQLAVENNGKMVEILNGNYGLIDPEDMQAFQVFRTHVMRYKIEQEIKPTWRVIDHLGAINFYNDEFAKRLEKRFLDKTEQLSQLRNYKSYWAAIKERGRKMAAIPYSPNTGKIESSNPSLPNRLEDQKPQAGLLEAQNEP